MYFGFKWCGCIWKTIAKPGTHDVHKYEGYIKCSAQCERGNLFLVITIQSSYRYASELCDKRFLYKILGNSPIHGLWV